VTEVLMPKAAADLSFFDAEPLLGMVATALVALSRRRFPGEPVYSDNIQNAYNHLVLRCLREHVTPPVSVPAMVEWAAKVPVHRWPLNLPAEYAVPERFLVDRDTRTPTQSCYEWTIKSNNAAAEKFENLLIAEVLEECRRRKSPESYTAFRELLITKPTLTDTQLLAATTEDILLVPLYDAIKRCYDVVPAALRRSGVYTKCARCGCLLVPIGSRGFRCELDRCRRDNGGTAGEAIAPGAGPLRQLARPLRMFITGPGLAETELRDRLEALGAGLVVQMWPNYDAYDLRVVFPDNRVWAIDVKDRTDPYLLGRSTKPFRSDPPFDRAFLVVPEYRFAEREDYRRAFERGLPEDLNPRIRLLTDAELVRMVRNAIRGFRTADEKEKGQHGA